MAMSKAASAKLEAGMEAIGFKDYSDNDYISAENVLHGDSSGHVIKRATINWGKSTSTVIIAHLNMHCSYRVTENAMNPEEKISLLGLLFTGGGDASYRRIRTAKTSFGIDQNDYLEFVRSCGNIECLNAKDAFGSLILTPSDFSISSYGAYWSEELEIAVKPRDISNLFAVMGEFYGSHEDEAHSWLKTINDLYQDARG